MPNTLITLKMVNTLPILNPKIYYGVIDSGVFYKQYNVPIVITQKSGKLTLVFYARYQRLVLGKLVTYDTAKHTITYTIDGIPPKVTGTSPIDQSNKVSTGSPVVITFSEGILASSNFNKIEVKNLKTNKIIKITKSISNNKLTIKTQTKDPLTWYHHFLIFL